MNQPTKRSVFNDHTYKPEAAMEKTSRIARDLVDDAAEQRQEKWLSYEVLALKEKRLLRRNPLTNRPQKFVDKKIRHQTNLRPFREICAWRSAKDTLDLVF